MAQSRVNENEVESAVSTKLKEPAVSNETEKEDSGKVNFIFILTLSLFLNLFFCLDNSRDSVWQCG